MVERPGIDRVESDLRDGNVRVKLREWNRTGVILHSGLGRQSVISVGCRK